MNSYSKYVPNVYLAKCEEKHEKGEVITVVTKYGKENECVVFNLIYEKDGYYYYSIVRADGFNSQQWAANRAERLNNAAVNATKRGEKYYQASKEGADFLRLGEPIKIGHHSEKRHRALIERNHNRFGNYIKESEKAEKYEARAEYYEKLTSKIDLSMPESIDYFKYLVEKAEKEHLDIKSGKVERAHSFSLTYAQKNLNNAIKNYELAQKLWGDN